MYTAKDIKNIVEKQRAYFRTGKTLDVSFRINELKKLRDGAIRYEEEFEKALYEDLGRSKVEAYLCDIGTVVLETNEMIKGLRRWAKPEHHFSGFLCFPSTKTKVYKMPYGVTLIISPFNFPILLTLGVLAAAIAGGNTAVIKTSSKSKACTEVLKKFIAEVFDDEYVTLVDGGHDIADLCLNERFDKIFYTGSPAVGRHVLSLAANNLTPVALELGGETGNWAIVRKDADLKDAARKIAFFKLCNAGQICININQVAVAEEVAEEFLDELKKEFIRQGGEIPEENPEYSKLITKSVFDKCERITAEYKDRVIFGGKGVRETLHFGPTIIYPVEENEKIVTEELFCPILPVVPYKDSEVHKILDIVAEREHPLALYLFTKNKKWAEKAMMTMQYGGGCVNEVCVHMMVKGAPFNGTGHSGMGAYHGIWGFREFTHPQTVLFGRSKFNLPLREHPYGGENENKKMKLIKLFEK